MWDNLEGIWICIPDPCDWILDPTTLDVRFPNLDFGFLSVDSRFQTCSRFWIPYIIIMRTLNLEPSDSRIPDSKAKNVGFQIPPILDSGFCLCAGLGDWLGSLEVVLHHCLRLRWKFLLTMKRKLVVPFYTGIFLGGFPASSSFLWSFPQFTFHCIWLLSHHY
jgi:hypothetical protein